MSSVDTSSTTASPSDGGEEDKDEKTDTATDEAIEFGDVAAREYLTSD
jgi:hypothetical protein